MKPSFERLYNYKKATLEALPYAIAEGYTEPIKVGKITVVAEAVLCARPIGRDYEIVCSVFVRKGSSVEERPEEYGTYGREIICERDFGRPIKSISEEELRKLKEIPDEMTDMIINCCNKRLTHEIEYGALHFADKAYSR